MTFKTAQSTGYNLTEAEMKPLWNETLAAYRRAYKEIDAELAKVYAKYLSTADPQDYYNIMIQRDRLTKLQKQISDIYSGYSKTAGKSVAASSELALTNNFYRQQYSTIWFSPLADVTYTATVLNPKLAELCVYGTADAWKQIPKTLEKKYGNLKNYVPQAGSLTERLLKNRTAELASIREAITSGLIQGKSYSKITKDVKTIIGSEAGGKLGGAKGAAARIVRTEGTRNLNAATYANMSVAESYGLNVSKMWDATLDVRTRGAHQSADGQIVGKDDKFTVNGATGLYPGQLDSAGQNINCRCGVSEIIDGVPPTARAGVNPLTGDRQVFEYKDFDTWAADIGLSKDGNGVWVKPKPS